MLKYALVSVGLCLSLSGIFSRSSPGTQVVQLDSLLSVYEEKELIQEGTALIEGDSHGRYLPKLVAAAERRGIDVVLARELTVEGLDSSEVLWGFYDVESNTIYLNGHLSPNGMLATLFHEMGHALGPKELWNDENGQVFAEALSTLSCQLLKLNIYTSSFGYFQRFPDHHKVLLKYAPQLERLAYELVAEVR